MLLLDYRGVVDKILSWDCFICFKAATLTTKYFKSLQHIAHIVAASSCCPILFEFIAHFAALTQTYVVCHWACQFVAVFNFYRLILALSVNFKDVAVKLIDSECYLPNIELYFNSLFDNLPTNLV